RAAATPSCPEEPPLLTDLSLDASRRSATDDIDQRRRPRHAFVGHERNADCATNFGEAGDVGPWNRLFDERERKGLEPADVRRRLSEREALVEIDAQRQAIADRGANGSDPRDALVTGTGDLDLGR